MKYFKILLILLSCCNLVYSQTSDKPFEIQLSYGLPYEFPRYKNFENNGLPNVSLLSLKIQKKITSNFFIGFEYQKTDKNLKKDFVLTFKDKFYEESSFVDTNYFKVINFLLNCGYSIRKKNIELGFIVGLGIQLIDHSSTELYASNYIDGFGANFIKNNNTNNLVQASIETTYFINKKLGITFGFSGQYTHFDTPNTFKYGKQVFGGFERGGSDVESTRKYEFVLIPSIGLKYSFKN